MERESIALDISLYLSPPPLLVSYWAELPGSARDPVLFSASVVTVAPLEFLILHKYLLYLEVVIPSIFIS